MPVVMSRAALPFHLDAVGLTLLRPQNMATLPVSVREPRHTEGPVRALSVLLGLPCSPLAHGICPVSTASAPRATGGPARGQKEVKICLEQPNHVSARRSQL